MKDILTFPVVGIQYGDLGLSSARELPFGAVLTLKQEPTNAYDSEAVAVYLADKRLGYLPNKGESCNQCWKHIDKNWNHCLHCNAGPESFIDGGLATRLTQSGALAKNYACFVEEIDLENQYMPITAKLILE